MCAVRVVVGCICKRTAFAIKKKDNSELTPLRVLDSHIMNIAVT